METTENNNYLLIFLLITVALVAIFFSVGNSKIEKEEEQKEEELRKIQITLAEAPILAKAVSVYNISQNKKIYGKNDEVALPIASLAKIMTILTALNNHEKGEIVSVPLEAVNQAGDFGLFANEKWKIEDLARVTLISSANDGAYALALQGENFLDQMNARARRIGATHTNFLNFTGLDLDLTKAGAFASAEDVNIMAMFAHMAYPEIFSVTTLTEINLISESGFEHNFKNTNVVIDKIPNLLFSKTGFTDVAGGALTVIFKNKRGEEIAVTLLGSTFAGRFTDMETIVNMLYNI